LVVFVRFVNGRNFFYGFVVWVGGVRGFCYDVGCIGFVFGVAWGGWVLVVLVGGMALELGGVCVGCSLGWVFFVEGWGCCYVGGNGLYRRFCLVWLGFGSGVVGCGLLFGNVAFVWGGFCGGWGLLGGGEGLVFVVLLGGVGVLGWVGGGFCVGGRGGVV